MSRFTTHLFGTFTNRQCNVESSNILFAKVIVVKWLCFTSRTYLLKVKNEKELSFECHFKIDQLKFCTLKSHSFRWQADKYWIPIMKCCDWIRGSVGTCYISKLYSWESAKRKYLVCNWGQKFPYRSICNAVAIWPYYDSSPTLNDFQLLAITTLHMHLMCTEQQKIKANPRTLCLILLPYCCCYELGVSSCW